MLQLFIHALHTFTATQQLKLDELDKVLGVNNLEYRLKTGENNLNPDQAEQWLFWLRQRLETPYIGLQLGHFLDLSQIGMIGHLMQTCRTIRESTRLAMQWLETNNPCVSLKVQENSREITMTFATEPWFAKKYPEMAAQILQMFVAATYINNNRLIINECIPLTQLSFTCPPPSDITYFEKTFGLVPEFRAAQNSWSFASEWYDCFIISHNKEVFELLHKCFETQIEAAKAQQNQKLSNKIKTDIAASLRSLSNVCIDDIATMYGLSTRAIQRILKSENTSFRQLREDVREELSLALLRDKSVSIKEISYLLGYAGMSAFSKAFKRWKGMSPTEYQSS